MRIKMQHQYVMASEFLAQQRKQVNGAYEVVGYDPVAKTLKDAKESGFYGIELAPFTLGKPVDHVNTNEIADVIGAMRETGAERTAVEFFQSKVATSKGEMPLVDYAGKFSATIAFEPLSTNETNFVNSV